MKISALVRICCFCFIRLSMLYEMQESGLLEKKNKQSQLFVLHFLNQIISILQITFVGLLDLAQLRVSRIPIFRSSQGVELGIPVCWSPLFVRSWFAVDRSLRATLCSPQSTNLQQDYYLQAYQRTLKHAGLTSIPTQTSQFKFQLSSSNGQYYA